MADQLLERLQTYGKGLFAGELGVRFVEATPERVCAELLAEDRHCTVPGVVHGGVIMSLADTMGGAATSLNLPRGAAVYRTFAQSEENAEARAELLAAAEREEQNAKVLEG
jgi:uncharacterized protein (TIGR00369 family)